MTDDWNDNVDVLAAGAICPMRGCGEINFTYHSGNLHRLGVCYPLEFKCSRCGLDFATIDDDLLFHSIRRECLWAGNHSA